MTYPVDDAGNVRVDFVWGHMPAQPNQQRAGRNTGNKVTDGNWTISPAVGSDNLYTGYDYVTRNTGDGWNQEINRDRPELIDYGSSDIVVTGYNNFPAFEPNYAGDGDTGFEYKVPDLTGMTESEAIAAILAAGFTQYNNDGTSRTGATVANTGTVRTQTTANSYYNAESTVHFQLYDAPEVPNLVGLTEAAATTALTNVGLVKGAVTTANNAAGATAINDGKIKTQSVAAGTTVDTGSSVALVKYAYTVTANPIAGINQSSFPGHLVLTGDDVYMFLLGRTTKPAVGNTITVASNSNSTLNGNWTVNVVEDNDSYNSGGTVVTMTKVGGGVTGVPGNTGGTWVLA